MPENDAQAGIDRGLTYAEACFETFRVILGQVFRWQAHMDRLSAGLDTFGMALPDGLEKRCLSVAAASGPDVLVRLTVSGGPAAWGLMPPAYRQPGVYIQAVPYRPRQSPVRLRSVNWPFPMRRKEAKYTADYAEALRALRTLQQGGQLFGEEALVCDQGRICSGTTANVLIYREGSWWTPDSEGVLSGIIRGYLIQEQGVSEEGCPRTWLKDCEALALTNSGCFIQPVSTIDGRELATQGAIYDDLWRVLAGQPGVPERDACN